MQVAGRRTALLFVWQPMPHIEERLLMHRLMLERGVQAFDRLGRRREIRDGFEHRVIARTREREYLAARRPDRRGTASWDRHGLAVRIDAPLEQSLETRIHGRLSESAP